MEILTIVIVFTFLVVLVNMAAESTKGFNLPKIDNTLIGDSYPTMINKIKNLNKHKDIQYESFKKMKAEYMKSKEWYKKRKQVLRRDNYACRKCGNTEHLEGHHIRYINLPNESINDIVILCRSCHQEEHDKYGYPGTYRSFMAWNHEI